MPLTMRRQIFLARLSEGTPMWRDLTVQIVSEFEVSSILYLAAILVFKRISKFYTYIYRSGHEIAFLNLSPWKHVELDASTQHLHLP